MTLVRGRVTTPHNELSTDNPRWLTGPQRHEGDVYVPAKVCSQKPIDTCPLYRLNHACVMTAYDAMLRDGVLEASLEYQTMVCSVKLYSQRLTTLNREYVLPAHSHVKLKEIGVITFMLCGGRGGAMPY